MTASMNVTRQRESAPSHLTSDELAMLRALLSDEMVKHRWQHEQHQALLAALAGDSSSEEREEVKLALDRAHDVITEVEHALARINEGTYGTCESCDRPIPFERLEAIPHAPYCVACPRPHAFLR